MRVFLWSGGHTIAESLYLDPPDGVDISSNAETYASRRHEARGERMFVVPNQAKRLADRTIYAMGVPRFLPILSRADLIHTVSGLVPTLPMPWITTISSPSSFYGLNDNWFKSARRVALLRNILRSRYCRKVTCFSEATLKGLESTIGNRMDNVIASKLEVMYPAVNPARFVQKRGKSDGPFRVLFVGNHFFDKGGRELYNAVKRLSQTYDIQLDLVTDAPPHHRDAFVEFTRRNRDSFAKWHIPGMRRRQLMEDFFPEADVFVMCSYMEIFGFVFLEAMASGLPIIAARVNAQPEIVKEGVNGYLIDVPITPYEGDPPVRTVESSERYRNVMLSDSVFEPVVTQISDRLRGLIEDDKLRREMSKESLEMTTNGRFSIKTRNLQLKRIYQDAVF